MIFYWLLCVYVVNAHIMSSSIYFIHNPTKYLAYFLVHRFNFLCLFVRFVMLWFDFINCSLSLWLAHAHFMWDSIFIRPHRLINRSILISCESKFFSHVYTQMIFDVMFWKCLSLSSFKWSLALRFQLSWNLYKQNSWKYGNIIAFSVWSN